MLETCKQLFSLWNNNEVNYCHWKSNEHLMDGLLGETDLDVFVLPKDKTIAESLLVQSGYIQCKIQKGHIYPNVYEWIGFDSATGKLVHVHLHYQVITGTKYCKEYVFPVDDIIISSRIKDVETGVYITNPNLEIIILFCRIALKSSNKRRIHPDKNSKNEIRYLKDRIERECVLSFCKCIVPKNGDRLFQLINKDEIGFNDWYDIYNIAEKWLKPYRKYSRCRVFFRYHLFNLRNQFITIHNIKHGGCIINKKVFPNRNFSVCLLGQDGSGKSTVTIELCKWLNWKIDAHRFYLGSGDHNNGFMKRLVSKTQKVSNNLHKPTVRDKESSPPRDGVSKKKNIKNFFPIFLMAQKYLSTARRAYHEILRAEKYCKKGGIPLYDRFPQVQFEGIYDGPKIESSYKARGLDYCILKRMSKKEMSYLLKIQQFQPTIVFKLILSPEESIRRKPFENIEAVTRKHEITKQLVFEKSMVYTIDAAQEYQQELIIIKNVIWDALLQNQ